MIDLHQGFSGEELKPAKASAGSVAMAQLEVAAALAHGRLREAAMRQLGVWKLAAKLALRR